MIRLRLTAAIAMISMRVNKVMRERIAGQRRIDRHQRQHGQQAAVSAVRGSSRKPERTCEELARGVHLLAAGNRPSGRNTRIAAISM